MALYNLTLDDEAIEELLDGERIWFDVGKVSISVEADKSVDHFTVREDAKEEGHKCGVKLPPEHFEDMLEDPLKSAGGWTAIEGGKLSSNEQIECILHHKDNPKYE
ncbi:MAG: hypothetical protein ABEH81_00950 [Halopenitus sp.]